MQVHLGPVMIIW